MLVRFFLGQCVFVIMFQQKGRSFPRTEMYTKGRGYAASFSSSFLDIVEKRKSFADMKLADVASGGELFNFDSSANNSIGGKDSTATASCNGHPQTPPQDSATEDATATETEATSPMSEKNEEDGDSPKTNGGNENDGDEIAKTVADASAEASKDVAAAAAAAVEVNEDGEVVAVREPVRLDPVNDICPELEVKIADLGNACWVVSLVKLTSYSFVKNSKFDVVLGSPLH